MPRTKISEFSATPASNTDIDSINISEGCAPSGINDAIRELMAQLKDFQTGAVGDSFNGPVGTTTAAAGAFTTLSSTGNTTLGDASGDSVTINGTATFANANPTLSAGTANGVAYLNGSKVVTSGSALTFDGTTLGVTSGSSSVPSLKLYGAAVSQGQLQFSSTANYGISGGPDYTGLVYNVGSSTYQHIWQINGSEAMRLTSTGLGIGTSSPTEKLEVVGNYIKVTGTTNQVALRATNTGGDAYFGIDNSAGSNFNTGTAYAGVVWRSGANPICFVNNSSEKMRLDSSGNLGLGVTPSAWTTFKVMQLGNFGAIGGVDSTSMNMFANTFYDGAFKYINTSSASRYRMDDGHSWFTAPSGTAGNAITFTQAATLTADGDYLVGTTTDSGSSSNIKKVVGGNFRSFGNTAVIPASSTGTILTLSSSVTGVYIINANFGPQGNAIYGGMLIVVANNGSFRIVTNGGGSSSALSLSGANVQITNAIGSPLDATGSAFFIGN